MAPQIVADGFSFIEGPRWHKGALWFSDMHDDAVFRLVPGERQERIVDVPHRPSGLGWLPDGDLLVSSMLDKTVYRYSPEHGLLPYADLSNVAERRINDMLVDPTGRCWIGNFGFDFEEGESPAPGTLARVDTDGSVHPAADGLLFANGIVMIPGTDILVVAESFAANLTAFEVSKNGTLSSRRVWAALPDGAVPDGICVDKEGAIWAASPSTGSVLRLREGGEVTDTIVTGRQAIAAALGGQDGRTLFVSTSASVNREECRRDRSACVEAIKVDIPAL